MKKKIRNFGYMLAVITVLWSQMGVGARAVDRDTLINQPTKTLVRSHYKSNNGSPQINAENPFKKENRREKHSKVSNETPIDFSKVNQRQIIVSFKKAVHTDLHIEGLTLIKEIRNSKSQGIQIYQVSTKANFTEVLKEIKQNSNVAEANPDYINKVDYTPTDQALSYQWYLGNVNMYKAWDVTQGSENPVVVAVLDTGVNANHPELAGKVLPGYDFVNNDSDPSDDEGHGSGVAGIIAANANSGETVGIDFNAKILPVKVANADGILSNSAIIQGIYYAIDHGADVINMSFGGEGYDPSVNEALYEAHQAGIVLVAAAGNDASSIGDYPAADNNVISVAATDENNQPASFSNWGNWIDVAAPGTNIVSIDRGSGYVEGDGTSFSAPIVSGISALLKSEHPTWSPDDIEWAIEQGTNLLGEGNWDEQLGYGRVNAYSALTAALPGDKNSTNNPISLQSGQSVQETLAKPNELDTYQFDVSSAAKVTITFSGGANYLDLSGDLYKEDNGQYSNVTSIDDRGTGEGESYTFTADPGHYEFSVYDYFDHWSAAPYTVQVNIQGVKAPTASVESGTYDKPFQVTLASSDGSPINYTMDGSTPSPTHGGTYAGPIQITTSTTLKAVTVGSIGVSSVATFTYTLEKVFVGDVADPATQIPVLLYHGLLNADENTENNPNVVPVEQFDEQMKYLADNGYHTVTAAEMENFLAGKIELPRRSVMIQFDDGLRSVYRYAYPIMQKYGFHGVVNIITGQTGSDAGAIWDPNQTQYMDQTMLDSISDVFDLESETDQLNYLSNNTSGFLLESPTNVMVDLQASRDKLAKYGDVNILAYPFGQFQVNRINLVKQSGFTQAFTTKKGYVQSWDDPFQLNREAIGPETSLSDFIGIISDTVEPIFTDIPLDHANFNQTFWLYSHHIIKGYPDGHFGPSIALTRSQAAKMLVQALGITVQEKVATAPFNDIPLNYNDQYLVRVLSMLKSEKIFNGDSQGNFRPSDILTREQMATVLVNTFHWKSSGSNVIVKDINQASSSHRDNIEILAQKGITVLPNGYFSPHGDTLRIHLASFLYKAMHFQ